MAPELFTSEVLNYPDGDAGATDRHPDADQHTGTADGHPAADQHIATRNVHGHRHGDGRAFLLSYRVAHPNVALDTHGHAARQRNRFADPDEYVHSDRNVSCDQHARTDQHDTSGDADQHASADVHIHADFDTCLRRHR
jgi:hypothetical protein